MSTAIDHEVRPLMAGVQAKSWIVSPRFDLVFFILAPLVTAPIVIGVKLSIPLIAALGMVLAIPHYLSTGSFLMWEENAAYQRSRLFAYAGVPILIALVYTLITGFHIPGVMQIALFLWTVFHVARQNCGILGIYRLRSGVTDPAQKSAANTAIVSVSAWLSLWFVDTHESLAPLHFDRRITQWAWIAAGSIALVAIVRLAVALKTRASRGESISFPELAFLGMSLTMFLPYALIHDVNVGTYVMLLPHYLQYLGIVWMMNRRRALASARRDPLRTISASLPLLIVLLVAIGVAGTMLFMRNRALGDLTLYTNIFNIIAFEHYYFDGLVWAFKQPHVRATLGPWLRPEAA
jgi:hypothetical protein